MPLAAALVLVVLILVVVLVLIVVLVLVVVLILILVIHFSVPPNILLGYPTVVCPGIYALSFGLNSRLIRSPAMVMSAKLTSSGLNSAANCPAVAVTS